MLMPLGLLSQGGGAAGGSFEQIETQILGSTTASITFSSIPSTYKHLQVRITARTTDALDLGGVAFRFNSDSGSNYTYHIVGMNDATAENLAGSSQTSGLFGSVTGNTSTASSFGVVVADIMDYANTSKNKVVRSLSGYTSATTRYRLIGSAWISTSAVTSLTVLDNIGGSFATGSRFTLYGIKG